MSTFPPSRYRHFLPPSQRRCLPNCRGPLYWARNRSCKSFGLGEYVILSPRHRWLTRYRQNSPNGSRPVDAISTRSTAWKLPHPLLSCVLGVRSPRLIVVWVVLGRCCVRNVLFRPMPSLLFTWSRYVYSFILHISGTKCVLEMEWRVLRRNHPHRTRPCHSTQSRGW